LFIGVDILGLGESGTTLQTNIRHGEYTQMDGFSGMWDDFYIDYNTEFVFTDEKPTLWNYSTLVNIGFQGNLEGGNISSEGYHVEFLKIQKRRYDSLTWTPSAILPYTMSVGDYSVLDTYIANDEDYVYSLVPMAANITGTRIVSDVVRTNFSGVFLSDKFSNFELAYDVEYVDIEHNVVSSTFEPLDSKYPIIVYSNSDYSTFSVTATSVAENSAYGQVDIQSEKRKRNALVEFLKNKKPKVYRDGKGDLKLVTVGRTSEQSLQGANGVSKVSFDVIEIGDIEDFETLVSYGLLDWGDE
jgi:hypothetical protein